MHLQTKRFDLTKLEDGKLISNLIAGRYNAAVTDCRKVGQGFYACVYKVTLAESPGEIIVKCHEYAGRCEEEARQLELLAKHSLVKVPEVFSLAMETDDWPFEAMIMEHIPGITAADLEFPDERTQQRFVDEVVENLRAWHAVSNAEGFGDIGGPLRASWQETLAERLAEYHRLIHQPARAEKVSDYVMGIIDQSFELIEPIFAGAASRSSLVHSDYNAWNMLADPASFKLTGVIDPSDAGWADAEIDLFHLANCRPEIGLLERYLQDADTDERFWMRYRFYRFWDDVKHYVRMGWYEEGRFRKYASELKDSMAECAVIPD